MNRKNSIIDHSLEPKGQFLVYEAENGQVKIDVRLSDETVWLTQQLVAALFQTTVPNISMHIRNIYEEGELAPASTVKKFLTVRREGQRDVQRSLDYYNLDMIISVGYRVRSHMATRFRICATQRLKEQIIKGFVLDDERERVVAYHFEDLQELMLAYAISVHKSKGSEYPAVIIPLMEQHIPRCFREIFFTRSLREEKNWLF